MTIFRRILFYIVLMTGFSVGTLAARMTKARAVEPATVSVVRVCEWKMLPTEAHPGKHDDIGFADAQHGWVGTMAGGYYTADDGKIFTPVPIARAANKFRVVPGVGGPNSKAVYAIGTQVQRLEMVP